MAWYFSSLIFFVLLWDAMRAGRRVPSPHRCIGCFQSAIFVNFRHMCKPMHQLSAVCSPRRRLDSPSEGERGAHPSPFFHGRKGFFPPVEHKLSSRRKAYFPLLGKINYPSAEPFRPLANNKIILAVRGATDTTATTTLSAVLAVATILAGCTVLLTRTTASFGGVRRCAGQD